MAPVTRQSASQVPAAGATVRKPTRKHRAASARHGTSGNWSALQNHKDGARQSYEGGREEPPLALEGAVAVEEAVNPLREMANKVGREVELFAERLDQFLTDLPTRENKYDAAQQLVEDFKWLAEDIVAQRKKGHEKERSQQLRKEWRERAQLSASASASAATSFGLSSMGSVSARKAEEVKELRQYEQEADIWELFRLMLELEKMPIYRPGDWQQMKDDTYAKMEEVHLYTPEAAVWERFLVDDDLARERFMIKRWLENTADHQEDDLQGIVTELEDKSGAGKGLWTQGWMHTREKIKGEKRLRSWPSGSQSVQPQIRNTTGNEMLVTTLDPDAPARQGRVLEKPDNYYEKAMWIAVWEMLRRGKTRAEIREWCEERNEGWRSVLLTSTPEETDASCHSAWRKMCYLASESECSNEYEAAVYGLLGGNLRAAQKACRTVDDHLFVHYSTMLVRQFEAWLQENYPSKVASIAVPRSQTADTQDSDEAKEAIAALIQQLRNGTTKEECSKPLKIVQGYLLAREVESLIETLGMAISDLDSMRGGEEMMVVRLRHPPTPMMQEAQIALDPHALRIVTHMYIILRSMDKQYADAVGMDAEENVIAAYVQALRASGERDAAPLYATQMSRPRQELTLAKVLQDVTQTKEQQSMLDLLDKYDLRILPILTIQLRLVLDEALGSATPVKKPLQILESSPVNDIHPGQRIMDDFYPETLTESDVSIVRSLQWFQLLRGHWETTFSSLSLALRKCLVTGRFACAVEIVRNFPYADISREKTYHILSGPINLMEKDPQWLNADTEGGVQEAEDLKLEVMRRQSRTYYELEQLIHAVESLASWVEHERPFQSKPHASTTHPSALKKVKVAMDDAMQPLLAGILRNPIDEQEATDLQYVRDAYLPEIIIAYNTALYTAGPIISRDSYITSMDLSVAVASEATGLTECFVHAGRVRELVLSFAQTSKMMLIMKANGGPRKAKKEKAGKDIGIWEIAPQGQLGLMAAAHGHDLS